MKVYLPNKIQIEQDGFTIIEGIFRIEEAEAIGEKIAETDLSGHSFRKQTALYAIRKILKEIPDIKPFIFSERFKSVIAELLGSDFCLIKSIYFDKPEKSNWFVAYHQDLMISVDKKLAIEGFGPWTIKPEQVAVQPPVDILNSMVTIRIHLDDTDENNGALKVIPGSHQQGVIPQETISSFLHKEVICRVRKGGIMVMKPLLLHSSSRTTNNQRRRVIHLEFSNQVLPENLQWSEKEM